MSHELVPVIAAAIAVSQNGQTPTLALVKAKVGGKIPMPMLVAGLQRFKMMSESEIASFSTLPEVTSNHASSSPSTVTLQLEDLQKQINALREHCQQLENRLLQLEQPVRERD